MSVQTLTLLLDDEEDVARARRRADEVAGATLVRFMAYETVIGWVAKLAVGGETAAEILRREFASREHSRRHREFKERLRDTGAGPTSDADDPGRN
jgi:hypothetical protein